ncbi:GNAT family N-acetyltransferase [Laceyella putida]|uniref:GNAT family N-acetyltransferase n=1 Tax=Laceyella putida TaxID=110101 RepID=A0ABW2RGM6_9BACL
MQLVHAHEEQLAEIMEIYRNVVQMMNKQGIYQWAEDYPNEDVLKNDIAKGNLYTLLDEGQIAAIVALDQEFEPEYEQIPWQDQSGRFLVVHRLCVNPDNQGKGVSRILMQEIERFAREHGYASIRLDTQMANEKAMRLYDVNGFEQRGTFHFPGSDKPHMAYEKLIG